MTVFYAAEIVGKAGLVAFHQGLSALKEQLSKEQRRIDFVVANADGATAGGGLGRGHAAYLRKLGANAVTLGDFSFYKKDLTQNLDKLPFVIRPYNLVSEAPGRGSRVFNAGGGNRVAVVQLLGQNGFAKLHGENPYQLAVPLLEKLRRETPYVLLDFHALATAEKKTLFALVDGYCSAAIGSHTRVQTTDNRVMRGGTACITDAGRTGCRMSVGGLVPEIAVHAYLTGIPAWQKEAETDCALQGVLVEIGEKGQATAIDRIDLPLPFNGG
ncbi:MAG: YmdB family metallophosphoesterase [Spirochaetaceae bacterium]|jgi:metallophosphoesterase (TIGR00282 family)|nr:YmdB family metallophosphoesterase [Spirochaetaceae bacterium]